MKQPKQKNCIECGKLFNQYNSLVRVCSTECAIKVAKVKVKKEVSKQWQKEKKEIKENITNWKNKLQTEVQLIARLIDKDLPCLARGKFGKMAGGHIFSKGGHSQMRFNLHNIHRQSFASNNCQNDDGLLREMLELEYGNEYLEFIKSLRKFDVPKKSNKEYQELYYNALEVTKTLKKANKTYSLKQRIELRNELNIKIGLYNESQCIFK